MTSYKIGDKVYLRYGNQIVYGEIIDHASWYQVKDEGFKVQTWFVHEDGSIGGKFIVADPVFPGELYSSLEELCNYETNEFNQEIIEFYEEYKGDGSLKNLLEIPLKIYEYYEGDEPSPFIEAYRRLATEYLVESASKDNDMHNSSISELPIPTKQFEYETDLSICKINNKTVYKGWVDSIEEYFYAEWEYEPKLLKAHRIGESDEFESVHDYFNYILDECWNDQTQSYKCDDIEIIILDTSNV